MRRVPRFCCRQIRLRHFHNDMLLMHSRRSIFGNQTPMQFLEGRSAFAGEDGCRRIGPVLEGRRNSIDSDIHRTPHNFTHARHDLIVCSNHNVPEKRAAISAIDFVSQSAPAAAIWCSRVKLASFCKMTTNARACGFTVEILEWAWRGAFARFDTSAWHPFTFSGFQNRLGLCAAHACAAPSW